MSDCDVREIAELLSCGNLYSAKLRIDRAWLEQDYPGAEHAVTVVELGDGVPAVQVPIIPCCAAASSAR